MKTLFLFLLFSTISYAFEEILITPNIPNGWETANVRDDALVEINDHQPLFGDGSLMFATDTVTAGQDKGDFQYLWQQSVSAVDFPNRILGNVNELSFAWYRDSASTTAEHFSPVVRLNFYDDGGTPLNTADDKFGFLIWEGIYNGINPAPIDSWQLTDIINHNFWIFVVGSGTVPVFNASLNDWINNNPSLSIQLSANTLITGINIGVGSGWGDSFIGYVDSLRLSFGSDDDKLYNFEMCDYLQDFTGGDVIYANSFECFKL
jgi:hypothetical protein